tara:strand:- start:3349 stop:4446 length:1098 start_codon:yes stop_codon:yes gene_type:complete
MSEDQSLKNRLTLSLLVILQVTLIPIFGFSTRYLFEIDSEGFSVTVKTNLIEWIVVSGVLYGVFSLFLALCLGGFRPYFVINRGGLASFLGLRIRKGDPELVDRSRLSVGSSPYGKMAKLVDRRVSRDGYDLIAVHGGLQLIAVPLQILLIAVPLAIIEGFPSSLIRSGSAFELGMAGYLASLWLAMRIQPIISNHLVGFASVLRTVIWRFSIFSWVLPIVIFWYAARMLLEASLGWLELDYADWNDLQIDAMVLGFISPDAEIPKSAVIDFLIAISVLPLATFTSISVLGGSNGIPDWMLDPEERLDNLKMGSLEAPESEKDYQLIPSLSDEGDSSDRIEVENESSQGRMIDLPFELLGRNGED